MKTRPKSNNFIFLEQHHVLTECPGGKSSFGLKNMPIFCNLHAKGNNLQPKVQHTLKRS